MTKKTQQNPLKPPFWATFLTLIGVCILCTLGTWQLQRLAWKNDLITNLETAYKTQFNTPLDFDEVNIKKTISGGTRGAPTISTTIVQPQEFKYGRVTGKLLNEKAFLVGPRTLDKKIGHNLIIPMSINSSQKTLLINLGWTDAQLHELLIDSFYDQTIWFEGITIVPKWNKFTPKNQKQPNTK